MWWSQQAQTTFVNLAFRNGNESRKKKHDTEDKVMLTIIRISKHQVKMSE
jgi:hypothetical protein